jgi:hypothetical protein
MFRSARAPFAAALAVILASVGVAFAQPSVVVDLRDRPVDPASFGRISGSLGNGASGVPVAGGADVDGDGHADYLIAAMLATTAGRAAAGVVHLVFGNGSFEGSLDTDAAVRDGSRVLDILGAAPFESTGSEVWMDDVDGDGLADVLVCRQNHSPDESRVGAGALTVLWGGASLRAWAAAYDQLDLALVPPQVEALTIVGALASDRFGVWVRAADVTGDGVADLIVAADQESGGGEKHAGAVYVVRGGDYLRSIGFVDLADGGASPLAGHVARILPPSGSTEYHFGSTCAGADLDGNGRAEVLASAALNRAGAALQPAGASAGTSHAVGGSKDGTAFIVWDDNFSAEPWPPDFTISLDAPPGSLSVIAGGLANRKFGEELLGGADYDADGLPDLFVGDIIGDWSPARDRPAAGSGHVFYDAASLKGLQFDLDHPPADLSTVLILGGAIGDIAGDTAVHGDYDGDGVVDLLVSSPHAAPLARESAGALHVLFGGVRWPEIIDLLPGNEPPASALRATVVLGAHGDEGTNDGDTLGYSAVAADIDGDGIVDVIANEMQGDGSDPDAIDVGNAVILSGALLSGLSDARCPPTPARACAASSTGRDRLRIVDRAGREYDRWVWRWRGAGVASEDFLAPELDEHTIYSACVYGGAGTAVALDAAVAGASACPGGPCWSIDDDVTTRYEDALAGRDGVRRIRLVAGQARGALIEVRAAGALVDEPSLPMELPLTVQLTARNGVSRSCWESRFDQARRNDARVFRSGRVRERASATGVLF